MAWLLDQVGQSMTTYLKVPGLQLVSTTSGTTSLSMGGKSLSTIKSLSNWPPVRRGGGRQTRCTTEQVPEGGAEVPGVHPAWLLYTSCKSLSGPPVPALVLFSYCYFPSMPLYLEHGLEQPRGGGQPHDVRSEEEEES